MSRNITKIETITPLPVRKKAAAYARVSVDKAEMLHSLAAQVSYYSGLIQNRAECEYAGVYADEAQTGTKASRPEFQRLLTDCRKGQIDLIITKSISRFARNTVTLLETVRELKSLGIGIFFEEQNIHTLSGEGELMLSILASYAQEESRSVSENMKWHIRNNYMEGKPAGNICVYGYDFEKGKLIINKTEAEVIRMIFADYLSGMGKNAIMKKLTRLGIPTKTGGRWSERTIRSILRNEKYIGDMCFQKKFIADHITKQQKRNHGELPKYYIENSHEAIIDHDTFKAVQAEILRRQQNINSTEKGTLSEFSGILQCQRCGENFHRKINNSGTKYAKAGWGCFTYIHWGKEACPAKRIPEAILKEKCAEALGLSEYDTEMFKASIANITVPDDGILIFIFKDGSEKTLTWQHRSRRESWTDEMKAAARKKSKEVHANGKR